MALPAFQSNTNFAKSTSSTTHTISHNNVSGNFICIGFSGVSTGGDVYTSITYAGVALTKAGSQENGLNGRTGNVWYLENPATGTNNIVVTQSVSERIWGAVASFTDAAFDATNKGVATGTTITQAITTTASDTVLFASCYNNRARTTLGTNTTSVNTTGGTNETTRSTAIIASAGATTLSFSQSASDPGAAYVIISMKESSAASAVIPNALPLLGLR